MIVLEITCSSCGRRLEAEERPGGAATFEGPRAEYRVDPCRTCTEIAATKKLESAVHNLAKMVVNLG